MLANKEQTPMHIVQKNDTNLGKLFFRKIHSKKYISGIENNVNTIINGCAIIY